MLSTIISPKNSGHLKSSFPKNFLVMPVNAHHLADHGFLTGIGKSYNGTASWGFLSLLGAAHFEKQSLSHFVDFA